MPILTAEGLAKTYGSRKVVDGVSFSVDYAEVVGLLGPNGAGKTTSFRMTCGMIPADAGTVTLNDIDVTNWPMYRRAKDGKMGYLAQEASVFKKLTVEQNLLGIMELLNMPRAQRRQRCEELLEQFQITHIKKSLGGSLSGGERRRLEIARCLVSEPEIILLDEPFTGIDPVTIESIQEIIRDLKARGISILITDHQVRETLEITDRSYVIHKGQVLCDGPPSVVLANPKARELYFGSNMDVDRPASPQASSTPSPPPSPPKSRTRVDDAAARPPAPNAEKRPARGAIHEAETLREDDL
jgi:lipopolysaccharide export system ATP-binding protein